MTVELTARLEDEVAAHLRVEAARAGLDPAEYLGRVLAADYRAAHGSREERIARAAALAAAAVHTWDAAGRPEDDGADFEDVFAR